MRALTNFRPIGTAHPQLTSVPPGGADAIAAFVVAFGRQSPPPSLGAWC